ncbi:NAD(P)/FAD-dependent oxidoreductase [Luteimonas sp. e5]
MTAANGFGRADPAGYLANYWHQGVPDFHPMPRPLCAEYDAIVIGAGYSGLAVAWGLAGNGLSVLVLDANEIGYGASTRNGGMVGPSFHAFGMRGLTQKYGEARARNIMRAGMDALEYCQDLFSREGFDCDFRLTGRFRGARSDADLDAMVAECQRLKMAVGLPYQLVKAGEVHLHTSVSVYKGGVLYPRDGGVHPKRLVNLLASRAESAGAHLRSFTPVSGIRRSGDRFQVATPEGALMARHLILATNGYSDGRVPAMNGRVVPVDVSVAATRHLGEQRVRAMSPRFHMHGETGRVFIWSRPSPDHARFIFGGRISSPHASLQVQQQQFAVAVQRLHPDLGPSDFEFVWSGKIAYTIDHAPHLNQVDGVWLIGGYCGSGVTRSLFFADKLVRKIMRQPGAETPFDGLVFPRVPFRSLAPFGARVLTRYYGWLDRRDARMAARK